jgi:hypothetical protein
MYDRPHLAKAERLLMRAKAAGVIPQPRPYAPRTPGNRI